MIGGDFQGSSLLPGLATDVRPSRARAGEPATHTNSTRCLTHRGAFTAPARPWPRRENLSLSVPDLLKTVKQFVQPDKHGQLDQMLNRYLSKELGKQQARTAPPTLPASSCHP